MLLANYLLNKKFKAISKKDRQTRVRKLENKEAHTNNKETRKQRKLQSGSQTRAHQEPAPCRCQHQYQYQELPGTRLDTMTKSTVQTLHHSVASIEKTDTSRHLKRQFSYLYIAKQQIKSAFEYFFAPIYINAR